MAIDTTTPNASRIYDYMLGGKHNYPADRAAAKQLLQAVPELGSMIRLFRTFLFQATRQLASEHFSCYLDLATGIPTEDYIHARVPDSAKIIYNDIDPETVAYAQRLVAGKSNIRCIQGDLRAIDPILGQAEEFFGPQRRIGIFMVGIVYFIEDAALAQVFQRLYEWAAPGSLLAVNTFENYDLPLWKRLFETYQGMGIVMRGRSAEELLRLAGPWQIAHDFVSLASYAEGSASSLEPALSQDVRGAVGYGGILVRS